MQENYRFPPNSRNQSMDLDVNGFYEIKWSGRDQSIRDANDSRYLTLINDPIYNKIPRDVLPGPIRSEHRFNIKIDGQINDELSVHYDIEQEPDFPGKYDIKIKHKTRELIFYHYDADFSNGSFVKTKKAMNGAYYQQTEPEWQLKVATGRQRSEPKKLEQFGTGESTYKLANAHILNGSVKVWVNNTPLSESTDFNVDYIAGNVTFLSVIPEKNDYVKIIYEFTNPIADFIPVLAKKSFNGLSFQYRTQTQPITRKVIATQVESLWSNDDQGTSTTHLDPDTILDILINPSLSPPSPLIIFQTASPNNTPQNTPPSNGSAPLVLFTTKAPIKLGSDVVRENGVPLVRNEAYYIDHATGKITLLSPSDPDSAIDISYTYYKTQSITEDKIGVNKLAPYTLQSHPIHPGSVTVTLGGIVVNETEDYIIDYENGILYFNYVIPFPMVISIDYAFIETETIIDDRPKKSVEFEFSYLSESSRSPENDLSTTMQNEPITINDNTAFTRFTPISNTAPFSIKTPDGAVISSDNYSINHYTGAIQFNSAAVLNGEKTVMVDYTYKKSFRTKYQFIVSVARDTFNSQFDTDFEIPGNALPIKYNGVDFIRYIPANTQTEIFLERGVDFEVDYIDNGDSMIITLFSQQTHPYSAAKLTKIPQLGDQIGIEYFYTPSSPEDAEMGIDVFGLTIKAQLGSRLSVDGEVAIARNNFNSPLLYLDAPEVQTGTGDDDTRYVLAHERIAENTELIYLNNRLQRKDHDYTINYNKGTVKFRNQTPGKDDSITFIYSYYGDGLSSTGEYNSSPAIKFGTTYESDRLTSQLNIQSIDRNFTTITPIPEKKGSLTMQSIFDWRLSDTNTAGLNYRYSHIDQGNKTDGEVTDRFYLNTHDLSTKLQSRLFRYIDTSHSLSYRTEVEDPRQLEIATDDVTSPNRHEIDTRTLASTTTLGFGPPQLSTSFKHVYSDKESDYIDKLTPQNSLSDTYIYSLNTHTDHFPILKHVTFRPQFSNSKSADTTRDGTSFSKRYSQGYTSKIKPVSGLIIDINTNQEKLIQKTNKDTELRLASETNQETRQVRYAPDSWLSTSYSHKLTETESPLIDQYKNIEDATHYNLHHFSPFGLFMNYGVSPYSRWVRPIKKTSLSLSRKETGSETNNQRRIADSLSHTVSITNISVLQGISLARLALNKSESNIINMVPSTQVSQNNTFSDSYLLGYDIAVSPKWPIVSHFDYTYSASQKKDTNQTQRIAQGGDSAFRFDSAPKTNYTHSLKLNPISIRLPVIPISLGRFSGFISDEYLKTETISRLYTVTHTALANHWDSTTFTPTLASLTPIIEEDRTLTNRFIYGGTLTPFNRFNLKGSREHSFFEKRSSFTVQQGTTLKEAVDNQFNLDWSPITKLTLSSGVNLNQMSQWISPTTNITRETLKTRPQNPTQISSYLNKIKSDYSGKLTFTPFQPLSLSTGATIHMNHEKQMANNFEINTIKFNQNTLTTGLTLRPFRALSLSGDYNIIQSKNNTTVLNWVAGQKLILAAVYTPIQQKTVRINIKYLRTYTKGYDFNMLQNLSALQETNQESGTQIIERNDYVDVGSLEMKMTIPFSESPFINEFQVVGEGYIKKIKDYKDPIRDNPLSYSFYGLTIKGSVIF
jgi:opacity protein-like surface antigen